MAYIFYLTLIVKHSQIGTLENNLNTIKFYFFLGKIISHKKLDPNRNSFTYSLWLVAYFFLNKMTFLIWFLISLSCQLTASHFFHVNVYPYPSCVNILGKNQNWNIMLVSLYWYTPTPVVKLRFSYKILWFGLQLVQLYS